MPRRNVGARTASSAEEPHVPAAVQSSLPSATPVRDVRTLLVDTALAVADRKAAIAQHNQKFAAIDARVEKELGSGEISTQTISILDEAGIAVETLAQLCDVKAEYSRAGRTKRFLLSYSPDELIYEAYGVLMEWRRHMAEAKATALKQLDLGASVARLRAEVQRHTTGADSLWPDHLRPQGGYRGIELAALRDADQLPRIDPISMWTLAPMPDQPWARLPVVHTSYMGATLLSDPSEFTYDDACAALRSIILDRMSRAAPSTLRLTWIDPVGHGRSAGPFLDLLEHDARLMDQAVWSEEHEIAEALRRLSERVAYLEQRCLKHVHPDIDAYNQSEGAAVEHHQIVAVTGFPHGFTHDTAQRLQLLSRAGARLGITVLTVADIMVRASFGPATGFHTYPVLTGSTQYVLPDGDLVFGHRGWPHVPVSPTAAPHAVWMPCEFPHFTDEAAKAIISGYAEASIAVLPPKPPVYSHIEVHEAQEDASLEHSCRLPNGPTSRALLIGASSYVDPELHDLPAVRNNLIDFAAVLASPLGTNLPPQNCQAIINPSDIVSMGEPLERHAEEAEDLLLVYYAGHGLLDTRGELYLASSSTKMARPNLTGLSYSYVRSVVANAKASNRVMILDCCYSGRAIEAMADTTTLIGASTEISGTYTLTSAPRNTPSIAPVGGMHTAFTGSLIQLLATGAAHSMQPLLSLDTIYRHLVRALATAGFPRPQQRGTQLSHLLALAPNKAYTSPSS